MNYIVGILVSETVGNIPLYIFFLGKVVKVISFFPLHSLTSYSSYS